MKKFTKKLLAVMLVICVAVSAVALMNVMSAAQAIASGVTVQFVDTDNYWLTVSGTRIKDTAKVELKNGYTKAIVIDAITWTGGTSTSISLSGNDFKVNKTVEAGTSVKAKIQSGSTTNCSSGTDDFWLCIEVKYHVDGLPVADTYETCLDYIYCTASQGYEKIHTYASGGAALWANDATLDFYPVSKMTSSASTSTTQTVSATLYVDTDQYADWSALNAYYTLTNGKEGSGGTWSSKRANQYADKLTVSQSGTKKDGGFKIDSWGLAKGETTYEKSYNSDTKEGPFIQCLGAGGTKTLPVSGAFPTPVTTQTYTPTTISFCFKSYGQTEGAGVIHLNTGTEIKVTYEIAITTYQKGELYNQLKTIGEDYIEKGLNQESYDSTKWSAYITALKNAYKVLGTQNTTEYNVRTAKSSLVTAYNNLIATRKAVVVVYHMFYGDTKEDITNFDTEYKKAVTIDNTKEVELKASTKAPTYNESQITTGIIVGDSVKNTNYTMEVYQYYWYVDRSTLQQRYNSISALINEDEAVNPDDKSPIYESTSWDTFVTAREAAQTALNNHELLQADINAADTELENAINGLDRIIYETKYLKAAMKWAKNIVDNDYDDDFDRDWDNEELFGGSVYTSNKLNALKAAYNAAKPLTATGATPPTKAQIDMKTAALWDAIDELRIVDEETAGLFMPDNEVACIATPDIYGYYDDDDPYTEEDGLTQVFEQLSAGIWDGKALDQTQFTAKSWNALQDALYGNYNELVPQTECCSCADYDCGDDTLDVPAYSMLHNIWFLPNQADYNACRDNLKDKVYHLTWVLDYTALKAQLQTEVEKINALNAADYTNASYAALTQKVADKLTPAYAAISANAPQYYGDENAYTAENVSQLISEVEAVYNALLLKPSFVPKDATVVDIEMNDSGDRGMVTGETVGSTVADLKNALDVENDNPIFAVEVYDANNQLLDNSAVLATGYTIKLKSSDQDFQELDVVVTGDVSGDADLTRVDFALVFDHAFSDEAITGEPYLKAADLNADGEIDLMDALLLRRMLNA